MTPEVSRLDQFCNWTKRHEKSIGWTMVALGLIAAAFAIGIFTVVCSADKGHIVNGQRAPIYDTFGKLIIPACCAAGPALLVTVLGLSLLFKAEESTAFIRTRNILIIAGLATLLFGMGLIYGANTLYQALSNDVKNNPFYPGFTGVSDALSHIRFFIPIGWTAATVGTIASSVGILSFFCSFASNIVEGISRRMSWTRQLASAAATREELENHLD